MRGRFQPLENARLTHPPIRSYVLRQGRFSPGQQRAFEDLMPRFGIAYRAAPLDFAATYGQIGRAHV